MTDVTALPGTVRSEASASASELFQLLYGELRLLAHEQSRRHAQPVIHTTALVHEAYLRFKSSGELRIEDRRHFLAYAAHVMRSVVVDHARTQLAEKRGSGSTPLTLNTDLINSVAASSAEVVNVHEALAELAALDERLARVVEMKYFGGMTEEEIADVLEISARTVQRDWEKARLILSASLRGHG